MPIETAKCPNCGNDAGLILTGVAMAGVRLVRHMTCARCGHAFTIPTNVN